MASVTESEISATFINEKQALQICQALFDMGYSQPPTSIWADNSTTNDFLNELLKKNR